MSSPLLSIDRIEFDAIKISANDGEFHSDLVFPQIEFDFKDVSFLTMSDLVYPEEEIHDPRHFVLVYGVKIEVEEGKPSPPYSFEIAARGYFLYEGDGQFVGADRFRAVRFSGYQVLHGAIREMVCNLTARGRHGLWHLPARHFGAMALKRAEADEQQRQSRLADLHSTESLSKPKRAKRKKVEDTEQGP